MVMIQWEKEGEEQETGRGLFVFISGARLNSDPGFWNTLGSLQINFPFVC